PNAFARGLGFNSMSTIGLMCADVADNYLARAVSYLEKGLRAKHYDSFLCCTGRDWEDRKQCTNLVLSRHVDGLILIGSHFIDRNDARNSYIIDAARQVPVVLIGGALDAPNVYSVLCDDQDGMEQMTGHVLEKGRKAPVYVYSHASFSGLAKIEGFKKACEKWNIPADDRRLIHTASGVDPIFAAKQALEEAEVPFDCVITSEDALAAGALKYAADHGLTVPGDLSVTGYNDAEIARACTPELTTLDNKLQALCERSIEVLMSAFKGEEVPRRTVFAGNIIIRSST
ncbi:MAG: LacI family transcriptional regulator, partial [Clostridiales bacterium]|nr:LacI family transcriptional regulator [Clostridiales bacterium]